MQEAIVGIWMEPWKIRGAYVIVFNRTYAEEVKRYYEEAKGVFQKHQDFHDFISGFNTISLLKLLLRLHNVPIVSFIGYDYAKVVIDN